MKQFFIILKFELANYMKNKVYIGLTVAIIIICAIILSVPSVIKLAEGDESTPESGETTEISDEYEGEEDFSVEALIVDKTGGGFVEVFNQAELGVHFTGGDMTPDEATEAVSSGEYEYCVYITSPLEYTLYTQSVNMYDTTPHIVDNIILSRYKYEKAFEYGLSAEQTSSILNAFTQSSVVETGKSYMQNFFYTYILIFMLYMAVLLYGQLVATSVATEKSSRAMELLITSAKPKSLMFGKVFGSGIAGMIQMTAILFGAFVFYKINQNALGDIEIINSIFNMPLDTLLYTLLFFVLGYFIYSFMYAACASLASKMEDVQTLIMPVMLLFVAAFIVSFTAMMGDVNGLFVKIMSFIPFTSPLVMFVRICLSTPAWWEITLSVIILVASTLFIGVLAAKIYRVGVLLYGKPPKLTEIFKALKKS